MRFIPVFAMLAVCLSAPAAAQSTDDVAGSEMYKQAQLKKLQYERTTLIRMADSMPERLYRDAQTPGQRDFAQQIHHAASGALGIGAQAMGATPPSMPDTSQVLNSRAGLKAYINSAYDFLEMTLKNQTAADRAMKTTVFGMEFPRWQWWDEIHQHTVWTVGSVVANFRKHGMAPPSFTFF